MFKRERERERERERGKLEIDHFGEPLKCSVRWAEYVLGSFSRF
jgi:hypothetical protein